MKIILENNVILDVFQNREPFVHSSSRVLRLVETKQVQGFVTANSITDIHYVLTRYLKDKQKVFTVIDILLQLVDIIDVTANDIRNAHLLDTNNFEDTLISVCAKRSEMDYIISRNLQDFDQSAVPAIIPDDFLTMFFDNL